MYQCENVEQLLLECSPGFRRIIRMYNMPEDSYQNGMIRAWQSIGSYDPNKGKSLKNWMFLNFKSAITTDAKRFACKGQKEIKTDSFDVFSDISCSMDSSTEVNILLQKFIDLSSEIEREIVFLMLDGFKPREIVEKLQLPSKTVDNAMQRIRKKMLRCMKEEGWILSRERFSRLQSPVRKSNYKSIYLSDPLEEEKIERIKMKKEREKEFWEKMRKMTVELNKLSYKQNFILKSV